VHWIDLTEDKEEWRDVVNMVMNLWVPQHVGKFVSSCKTTALPRRAHLHEVCKLVPGLIFSAIPQLQERYEIRTNE
jgi:hypothetical protein